MYAQRETMSYYCVRIGRENESNHLCFGGHLLKVPFHAAEWEQGRVTSTLWRQ